MSRELFLFLRSLEIGAILVICYDVIRAVRKVIPHNGAVMAAEDICYWILGGLFFFSRIYQENYGTIRNYIIAGVMAGGIFYYFTISPVFVRFLEKILGFPVRGVFFLTKRLLFWSKRVKITMYRQINTYCLKKPGRDKRVVRFGKSKRQKKTKKQ